MKQGTHQSFVTIFIQKKVTFNPLRMLEIEIFTQHSVLDTQVNVEELLLSSLADSFCKYKYTTYINSYINNTEMSYSIFMLPCHTTS